MEIEEVAETTIDLINTLCSQERAESLISILGALEFYWTAPASSKEEYHNAFPGGLARHNLLVLKNLLTLNEAFDLGFPLEEVCVVSICHDLGKAANTDMKEYYTVCEEKWKQDRGQRFDINEGSVYMPTHQRTMFLLQKFGFQLSAEEYQCIATSDGMYLKSNETYAHRQTKLAVVLHMADMLASIQEKEKNV